jgi:hypothetical protein
MPALPLDIDLLAFLATVGRILFGSMPNLRKNVAAIPAEYAYEEIPADSLTDKQKAFFAPYDKKLSEMQYSPLCTYRVRNYGANLMRRYINPTDRAACTVLTVEVKARVDSVESVNRASNVSFFTVFTDGKQLTTRNMRVRTVLDHPPEYVVQECPYEEDLSKVKKRHDARAAKLGVPVAAEMSVPRVFEFYQKQHQRFSEFQVERGTYERTATGYVVGRKAFWRGIRNFLVPFAERFSVTRLALAGTLAVGIPAFAHLRILPMVMQNAERFGVNWNITAVLVLVAGYVLAGVAVGLLLEKSQFVWGFLFCYVGVHLVTGWWTSPAPLGLIAAVVGHTVAHMRKRQRIILRASEAR